MLKRVLVVAYGLIGSAVFFATYLHAVGFGGNLLVPRTIDGPPAGSLVAGAVVDQSHFTRGPDRRGSSGRPRVLRAAQ